MVHTNPGILLAGSGSAPGVFLAGGRQGLQGCALVFTALLRVQTAVPHTSAQLWGLGQADLSHLVVLLAGGRILLFSKDVFVCITLEPLIHPCPILCFLCDCCKSSLSSFEEGREETASGSSEILRGAAWAAWGVGEGCEQFRMSWQNHGVAGTARAPSASWDPQGPVLPQL